MMDEIMTNAEYHVALKKMYRLLDSLCNPANAGKISEIEKRLSELEDSLIAWEEAHYPIKEK